jgi:hypothetical protein
MVVLAGGVVIAGDDEEEDAGGGTGSWAGWLGVESAAKRSLGPGGHPKHKSCRDTIP